MKRRPLLAFFALTFGLTWGSRACFALFSAQLIAVFGKVSVIIWGVWHLPAFIIGGTPQNSMSLPLFMIGIVANSVLMTWTFKDTRGSVLATVLIHWGFNTCADLTRMPLAFFSVGLIVIAAALVVAITGPELSRSRVYDGALPTAARA